jgi:hypothetical protein
MLAATFFSLLQPALDYANAFFESKPMAGVVIAGLLGGAIGLYWVHRSVPHEHFVLGKEEPDSRRVRRLWLFIIAITLPYSSAVPSTTLLSVQPGCASVSNGAKTRATCAWHSTQLAALETR